MADQYQGGRNDYVPPRATIVADKEIITQIQFVTAVRFALSVHSSLQAVKDKCTIEWDARGVRLTSKGHAAVIVPNANIAWLAVA